MRSNEARVSVQMDSVMPLVPRLAQGNLTVPDFIAACQKNVRFIRTEAQ